MGRMDWRVALATAVLGLLGAVVSPRHAQAYTSTVTPKGVAVRWKKDIKLPLAGNPQNRSGIDHGAFFNSVVRSLQRWKAASGGSVGFDYWQGTDPSVYEPNSDYNGLSSIYFASNGSGAALSANVLGLTQVWYDTDSGKILETDIVLNDIHYQFTTDPRDSTGSGAPYRSTWGRQVYIENVLTHELGHALGLSHSGALQSSMLFMESPEQAFLGCDEQVGIQAIYPSAATQGRGGIRGRVVAESTGQPIFGAHVLAISRRRGTVLASAVTGTDGQYQIHALEPGSYFLMVEPFYAGASTLPSYYAGINANVCNDRPFSRSVLADGANTPRAIGVSSGSTADAGDLVARCGNGGGAAVMSSTTSASLSAAPTIYDGAAGQGGFGVADQFNYSNSMYYRLAAVSGRVEVRAMGYSLYSPVHAVVSLLDSRGSPVPAQRATSVYSGVSGYVNYDSAVVAENLPPGDYWVRVTSNSTLDESLYPAGMVSLDSVHFVLLTGSVNEPGPPMSGALAFNARCRMEENFAAYSSPPGPPQRHSMDQDGGIGFCGSLSTGTGKSSGSSGGPTPPSAGAIAGWFLPWVAMALFAQYFRRAYAWGLRASPAAANL